jgi:hypothetical protein
VKPQPYRRLRSSDPDRSILKRNADEIALPPDHAALANGVKIVEAQFEIRRQRIEGVKFDSGPGICDAARQRTAARLSRSSSVPHIGVRIPSALPTVHTWPRWQRLANCVQAAITFGLIRKQSILIIVESRIPRGRIVVVQETIPLRLEHSSACSASGTRNRA